MLKKHSQVFRSLCAVADMIAVTLSFWAVQRLLPSAQPAASSGFDPGWVSSNLWLWGFSVAAYALLLRRAALYAPRRGHSPWSEIRALVEVSALATLLITGVASVLANAVHWGPWTVTAHFAVSAGALTGLRLSIRAALAAARRRGFNLRHVLIAGTGPLARDVAQRLERRPEMGFRVVGFAGSSPAGSGLAVLGGFEALRDLVIDLRIDQVFVAVDRSDPVDPIPLVEALRDTTASVRIATDLRGVQTIGASGEELDGLPLVCVVESPVLGWSRVFKRTLDIGLAGAALLALAPLMAAIAIAIRRSSPRGPVLYRQRRASLDAREFTMLKFRTMVTGAEDRTGPVWAERDDPRCTRLGRWLRRTSLDELPQLWNVLRGEMSLVGPRPERPELIVRFREQIDGYMLRHKMKAGLTGLAQVNGLRGNTPLDRRIAYDLRYAAEWSIGLDLKILLWTVLRAFRDRSAY